MNNKTMAQSFFVSGVCCGMEEAIVRKHLDAIVGPEGYTFNPLTYKLCLLDGAKSKQVTNRLAEAGFATRSNQELELPLTVWERHKDGAITTVAAVLFLTGLVMEHMGPGMVARGLLLCSIIVGGGKIAVRSWKSLRTFSFDMNVLMSIAVIGALLIGKWTEGAAVVVLYAFSLMLESYSVARTRRAIQSLMDLSPQQVRVVLNGKEEVVAATDIVPGQHVFIRPGERIPIDGVVVEGQSLVDQSAITGEGTPISRSVGENVYAGSFNRHGAIHVNATSRYEDSTLAKDGASCGASATQAGAHPTYG